MPPESECSQVRRPEAGKVEVPPYHHMGEHVLQGVGERIPSPLGGSATRNQEDRLWEKVSKQVLGN